MNMGIRNGRLCGDPVLKEVGSSQVATFSIAVNGKYKNRAGESVKTTAFLNCEAWGKTAETIAKWFHKGAPITIRESIKQDEWADKNTGEKKTRLVFRVEEFWFEDGYDYQNPKGKQTESSPADEEPAQGGEDNVPF